ncbi:glycosyltransferase family 2 protein [Kocuria sp. CPCC 205258]|uniref:glycosyltransferase family 2 protein n=1 Tax=Kocuria sp. CPCC 205258 TaxID=3073552 RepID=UPI0034D60CB1
MSSAPVPLIDVIIPVHSTRRPVGRAVASVVAGGLPVGAEGRVRITVVCHNIEPGAVLADVAVEHRDLVTVLECEDGRSSAAGPRNLALAATDARYVSFLDSDDTLDPGALARWLTLAEAHGSAAVVPWLTRSGGGHVRTPVTRPRRTRDLDVLRDRVLYRTSAFGLVRTETARALGLAFDGEHVTAEDQEFALRLYVDGGRIDYARGRPGYIVWSDAGDRVTAQPRPLEREMAAFVDLAASEWFRGLPLPLRRSFVVKVLRVHLFGHVGDRAGRWTTEDADGAARAARALLDSAPGAEEAVARADRDLLDLLLAGTTDAERIGGAAAARRRFGRPATLFPRRLSRTLHRDGSLRFMAGSLLA